MLGPAGRRTTATVLSVLKLCPARAFVASPVLAEKPLPPRPVIDDAEIEENFVKGSGPGGQKINKTSSAVQLIHRPTGIVVKCQETRSRSQNRKIARKLLGDRIELLQKGEESRVSLKAAKAKKKKASADKKKRRKYRKLDEEKRETDEEVQNIDPEEQISRPSHSTGTNEDHIGKP